jgi:hypothetical protein
MNREDIAEEMGIDLFCKGCRLDPSHCVCGFTEDDFNSLGATIDKAKK